MSELSNDSIDAIHERIDRLERMMLQLMAEMERIADYQPSPQGGRIQITREIESQVLRLKSIGFINAKIARRLGISAATVSQLVNGKYHWTDEEQVRPPSSMKVLFDELTALRNNLH